MSTEAHAKRFHKGKRIISSTTDRAIKFHPAEN
jgi:hypothetical protein